MKFDLIKNEGLLLVLMVVFGLGVVPVAAIVAADRHEQRAHTERMAGVAPVKTSP